MGWLPKDQALILIAAGPLFDLGLCFPTTKPEGCLSDLQDPSGPGREEGRRGDKTEVCPGPSPGTPIVMLS